jgi:hypothetical protein
VLRHWQWRRTFLSRVTVDGAVKKGLFERNCFVDGLFFTIVSSLGYFCLNNRYSCRAVQGTDTS